MLEPIKRMMIKREALGLSLAETKYIYKPREDPKEELQGPSIRYRITEGSWM
jgi:hypothetical protein